VETLTLTELGARMARRWRTLVAGALIGLTLGTAAQLALPTRYEATTLVQVDADDPEHVDMAGEEAVATSRRVTAEALDALGDDTLTIQELERATHATAVDRSRLLRIGYAAAEPRDAARGADAVALAYLAARSVDAAQGRTHPAVQGTVVDPARPPTSRVGPGVAAAALAGTVLGLLLAAPVASRTRAGPAS